MTINIFDHYDESIFSKPGTVVNERLKLILFIPKLGQRNTVHHFVMVETNLSSNSCVYKT